MVASRTLWPGFLLVAAFLLQADTVELTPVADTCIAEYWPEKNFGAMHFFNGGTTQNFTTNRGLLRFDIAAAVPPGAKILAATLSLEVVGQPDEPWNSSHFGLHRLLKDWGEGDNFAVKPSLAAAGTNEATWTHRYAGTDAAWGVPGGQSGVDYLPAPAVTTWVYEAGRPYTFNSTPALVADMQAWLDRPATNFGWMLILQNETTDWTARRFGSREDPSPVNTPRLTVDYTPLRIQDPGVVSNQFRFHFTAFAGRPYDVLFSESPAATNWQILESFPAAPADTNHVVIDPLSATPRFYRLTTP